MCFFLSFWWEGSGKLLPPTGAFLLHLEKKKDQQSGPDEVRGCSFCYYWWGNQNQGRGHWFLCYLSWSHPHPKKEAWIPSYLPPWWSLLLSPCLLEKTQRITPPHCHRKRKSKCFHRRRLVPFFFYWKTRVCAGFLWSGLSLLVISMYPMRAHLQWSTV